MRFLLDQSRSPRLAVLLREAGHDAVHSLDLGLAEAEDDEVLDVADAQDRVLISGDTDFGALLALLHRTSPSVVLFRARNLPLASQQAAPHMLGPGLPDTRSDLTHLEIHATTPRVSTRTPTVLPARTPRAPPGQARGRPRPRHRTPSVTRNALQAA